MSKPNKPAHGVGRGSFLKLVRSINDDKEKSNTIPFLAVGTHKYNPLFLHHDPLENRLIFEKTSIKLSYISKFNYISQPMLFLSSEMFVFIFMRF